MAVPNNAYFYGTTPAAGGGVLAFLQGLSSGLLGVNTSIAAAITSTGSQAVTPAAMTNIGIGTALWINWGSADQECVSVTAVTGSTFTASFVNTHSASSTCTVGLPSLGVSSPWTKLVYTDTMVLDAFRSDSDTADGDASSANVGFGYGSGNRCALFTADDFANNASTTAYPINVTNLESQGGSFVNFNTLQDGSFSWWACVCEFAIYAVAIVGSAQSVFYAGALRRCIPIINTGSARVSTTITAGATSVSVDRDLTARLRAGQTVYLLNQSHDATSAHWGSYSGAEKLTVLSVTSSTVSFTAGTAHSYDTHALVGQMPQNVSLTASSAALFDNAFFMSTNNDGSYTSYSGNQGVPDSFLITTAANSYNSPSIGPQVGIYYGEVDVPLNQTNSSYEGYSGFPYCAQLFVKTGVSVLDTFYDQGAAWKAFPGTNCAAMGPIFNPMNTASAPTVWIP